MQAEMATNYGLIMAGAALAAVPIVAVFSSSKNPSHKESRWELLKDRNEVILIN